MTQAAVETQSPEEFRSKLWSGRLTELPKSSEVNMAPTPQQDIALIAYTKSKQKSMARVSSGANYLKELHIPGSLNAPVPLLHNFKGNNLEVTNTTQADISIWVAAYQFGYGKPARLRNNGDVVKLKPFASAQGSAKTTPQTLTISAPGPYSVFAVWYGLEAGIYAVNAPGKVPEGYTEVTAENQIQISQNFKGEEIYVANLSPYSTKDEIEVSLF